MEVRPLRGLEEADQAAQVCKRAFNRIQEPHFGRLVSSPDEEKSCRAHRYFARTRQSRCLWPAATSRCRAAPRPPAILPQVTPAFTSARTVINYPKDGMTSLLLSSDDSDLVLENVKVESHANATTSSVVFSINHFTNDLTYDPDLAVLVGRAGEDNCCSGSDLALIVAVAVVVPVAVLFVLAVIVASLLVYFQRQKRRSSLRAVSYDTDVCVI